MFSGLPRARLSLSPILFVILLASAPAWSQTWTLQPAPTGASLRGISVINARTAWASGAGGTVLRTTNGGKSWQYAIIPGAPSRNGKALDFRGIAARSAASAWLVSSGAGDLSRIYRTADAGQTWQLLLTNPDPQGFFDGIAFWDDTHGIVFGDPVDGAFVILTTSDAGTTWKRQQGPAALPGEGAFAASNTSLIVTGSSEVWFATGGVGAARIFHSADRGYTWTVAATPVRNDSAGAGIFTLSAMSGMPGHVLIAGGGDFAKPQDARHNIAISADDGATWTQPPSGPRGYRSAIAWLPRARLLLTTGPSGSELSRDNGRSWIPFDDGAFHAIGVGAADACWAVGPNGRIAMFHLGTKLLSRGDK